VSLCHPTDTRIYPHTRAVFSLVGFFFFLFLVWPGMRYFFPRQSGRCPLYFIGVGPGFFQLSFFFLLPSRFLVTFLLPLVASTFHSLFRGLPPRYTAPPILGFLSPHAPPKTWRRSRDRPGIVIFFQCGARWRHVRHWECYLHLFTLFPREPLGIRRIASFRLLHTP